MPFLVADPYAEAVRNGVALHYSVAASYDGDPVVGASDLRPVGGTITDTSKPGVRRLLNLDLAGGQQVYNLLKPVGTLLTVTCRVRYLAQNTVDVPMGVFDVDSDSLSEGDGRVSLTAPDKWVRIQRARFMGPAASDRGSLVTEQIATLIRGALGADEPVVITATSTAKVGALTWDKDRDRAIQDLAASIGAWVFFDRLGVATVADVPVVGGSSDWLLDASPNGVLIDLDRQQTRTETRNVVVVSSSASDAAKFPTQYVWDNDPASPTYAGPGSGSGTTPPSPSTAGPFGIVPYFYDSPILASAAAAQAAGRTILSRTTGLASQISAAVTLNPAMDAFDVLDVLPPGPTHYFAGVKALFPNAGSYPDGGTGGVGFGESFGDNFGGGSSSGTYPDPTLFPGGAPVYPGSATFPGGQTLAAGSYAVGRVLERHVADVVTHPLVMGSPMQVEGRSTRTDPYTDGG